MHSRSGQSAGAARVARENLGVVGLSHGGRWISRWQFAHTRARSCSRWLCRSVLTPLIGQLRIQLLINRVRFVGEIWLRCSRSGHPRSREDGRPPSRIKVVRPQVSPAGWRSPKSQSAHQRPPGTARRRPARSRNVTRHWISSAPDPPICAHFACVVIVRTVTPNRSFCRCQRSRSGRDGRPGAHSGGKGSPSGSSGRGMAAGDPAGGAPRPPYRLNFPPLGLQLPP